MSEALRRGVSRTQIVEEFVLERAKETPMLAEGKTETQPHSGEGAANIHDPSAGGSGTRPIKYQTAREARSSK